MGIKVVTSFSLLSVSLQFHLTQFGAFKNVLSHLLEKFCEVTTKPNNDHFEINRDRRLRSGTEIRIVLERELERERLCPAPTPHVLIRKSGWRVTKIRFNLPDIYQIPCPFSPPAVWGGILSETHKLEAKVSSHSRMTRWQNPHEA